MASWVARKGSNGGLESALKSFEEPGVRVSAAGEARFKLGVETGVGIRGLTPGALALQRLKSSLEFGFCVYWESE